MTGEAVGSAAYIVVITVHRQYAKGFLLCSNGNSL